MLISSSCTKKGGVLESSHPGKRRFHMLEIEINLLYSKYVKLVFGEGGRDGMVSFMLWGYW
jgi:hypothetical protein